MSYIYELNGRGWIAGGLHFKHQASFQTPERSGERLHQGAPQEYDRRTEKMPPRKTHRMTFLLRMRSHGSQWRMLGLVILNVNRKMRVRPRRGRLLPVARVLWLAGTLDTLHATGRRARDDDKPRPGSNKRRQGWN